MAEQSEREKLVKLDIKICPRDNIRKVYGKNFHELSLSQIYQITLSFRKLKAQLKQLPRNF
jgi:hypothetical protein